MTKPDKPPAAGANQKTPNASKRDTKIYDHFTASGNKKGKNLTQDSTKTDEIIPPAPVTNDKPKDPDEKGSPIPSKDLQDQFNNDPSVTDPYADPNAKISANVSSPADSPTTPSTYAAVLTDHPAPEEEEDFLTQGGFTIHETDKRKRSTSTATSPSPSLRSPDAKQKKLFQKGHSPHRHTPSSKQAPPTTEPDVKHPPTTPPLPKGPPEEKSTDHIPPGSKETPQAAQASNTKQDLKDANKDDNHNIEDSKENPKAETTGDTTKTPATGKNTKKDKTDKSKNFRFATGLPNAIDKKKPLTHAYLSMIKVDMTSTPFSPAEIKKSHLHKIHHLFKENQSYIDIVGDIRQANREILAEFCSECLKHASVYHDDDKAQRGTNLIKRTLRRLGKNALEDFPSWDPETLAFSDTPSDMERLMIAMLDVFGPVQLVTDEEEEETPAPGGDPAQLNPKSPSPKPKYTSKTANPYVKNPITKPPNKAKKGDQAKKKKITLTPLFLKVTPPPHDTWGDNDNAARNQVHKDLMQQLMDQIIEADPDARLEPYDTPFTRARNKPQQRWLGANSKGLPGNPYMTGWYWAFGFLYSSGNQSQFQIKVSTAIEAETFVQRFNDYGQESDEDELDAFQVKIHPIQNGDTTCVAILPGTTVNTDCEYLQQELTKAINTWLKLEPGEYRSIYCEFLNIQLNQQERKDIRNAIKQYEYIPAVHIFCETERYKEVLAALSAIYHRKKKTDFPTGVKYACVPASDTKGYRGNRNDIEEINEALKQEQKAFLADLEIERVTNVIRGDPNKPFDSRMPTITLASLIRSFRTRSRGPPLFIGFDRDIHRPDVYVFTFRAQDREEAMAIIDGLGIALAIRIGPAIWKAFTVTARKVQENSYKYDKESERFSTQEERTVHNTWNHDIFQGRNKSQQQQVSCPIKHSTFECREINAFKDTTILSVFPSANGSVTTATQIPADWDLLTYFNSVNSAVAWDTAEEDEIDFDDIPSDTSEMDTSHAPSLTHDRPPPAEIDVPNKSPPRLPPMQEEQHNAIHHLPEELKPHHADANSATSESSPNANHDATSQTGAGHSTTNISSDDSSEDSSDDSHSSSQAPTHSNNPKPQEDSGPEEAEQENYEFAEGEDDDDDEEMPTSLPDEDDPNGPAEDMEHEEHVPNNLPALPPPAKEDKSKTLKLFSLETCQSNPSALTPTDPDNLEPIRAGLNKWYDHPARKRDKEEDRTHLEWMAALIATSDNDSTLRQSYNSALKPGWSLSDTIYWLTFLAKFSPIVMTLAGIPSSIPPNTLWTPILPIAFITSTEEVDRLTAALADSWIFSNPLVNDQALIPHFLLDFSFQTGLTVDEILPWLFGLKAESAKVQMSVIRYWQTWLYFKQVSDNESRTSEAIPLPSPRISMVEDSSTLLNLPYIKSRIETYKDLTEIQYSNLLTPSVDTGNTT